MTDAGAASSTRQSPFVSLRHRNARLYLLGLVVSNVGTWLQSTAQVFLVLRLTDSGVALGLVTACQFLPMLVLGPWAGTLADRMNRRRLVFVTQAAAAVQAVTLGVLDLAGLATLPVVYLLAVVLGVVSAIDNPSRRSFYSELVEPHELTNAMSLNTSVMTGSRIFGPALAALLVSLVGTGWCFVINGLSFAAVLGALAAMDAGQIRRSPPLPRAKGQVREGLRAVRADRVLTIAFVALVVVSTVAFNYQVTLPLLVSRAFDGTEAQIGWMLAVSSVGSLLGSLVTASRTTATLGYLLGSVVVLGASMVATAWSPTLWAAFALSVPMGAGGAAFIAATSGLLISRARPEMRGRLLALQATAFLGSTPFGSPFVGAVAEALGSRWGLGVGGVLTLVCGTWIAGAVRRLPVADRAGVTAVA